MVVNSDIRSVDERHLAGLGGDRGAYRVNRVGFRACPICNGPVYRIRRRFVDRLISRIRLMHRYRCEAMGCDWEGILSRRYSSDFARKERHKPRAET